MTTGPTPSRSAPTSCCGCIGKGGYEDHVFDAKFKVRRLATEADDGDEEDRGVFKRADLYKMHAYRDALPSVRSAWVLYPGTELRFFSEDGRVADRASGVADQPSGVGALPFSPSTETDCMQRIAQKVLGRVALGLQLDDPPR